MAEEIIQEEVLPVEEVSFEQPKPKTYLQKVHANLVDLYGKDQVPDEVTFSTKMKDPNYVKAVHANLIHEYGQSEVPDIKSFTDSLAIVGPEKKNSGLGESKVSGVQSVPTELPSLSTKNNVQETSVVEISDPFDKNANPSVLARQSYQLKQPKELKENVSVSMMGLPVVSYDKKYDENDINVSNEIDKHLKKLGYSKDFVDQVSRIPESYRESTGYTDQELADLYKNDKNEFNKRTSEVLFREELANGMNDIKSSILRNTNLSQEQRDAQLSKIQDEENLQNQEALSTGGGFKNKQYFIGQTAKRIKQFIADPEKQKKALEDLATYAADDFGSLEDLEDKNKAPISPNLNDYQSVALNYLEQIDPDKAAFYKKYVDIDKSKLKEFEYKGYQQILKELDEIGLNLVVNNAQNQIKPLADLAKQQNGQLDPSDYEAYNKLLETANLASTRLAKINQVYPDAKNLDTEKIAEDLVGPRYSELEVLGNKALYGFAKTGKGIYDIAAYPFRTQQENDNAALEALGIENYVTPKTTASSKNSILSAGEAKLNPELEAQRKSIMNDKSLSQDEKVDKMVDLLERNPDKWVRPSEETKWNIGVNAIASSLLNFAADIAPFIALETLTGGGATSASASSIVKSFGKMFANVAVTSYSDELARQLKEKNPNPELAAYGNILVNTIAYKLAGVSDLVKGVRGGAKELGGITEKVISKLDDKAILAALEKPNPTLKSFLTDFGKTVVKSSGEGLKSGAAFETVMGAKEALEGQKIDSEFLKRHAVGLLNFSLFNIATKSAFSMPNIDKQSKEALFLAATNKDEVMYEAEKALANKQITESAYNQIKNNVDAAYKVLERVPMVNGKGEKLNAKEASELMYLKIQEQFYEDQIKKDVPPKVQEKITKELADVQDKIDKVYKGTFIEDAGKPFAGIKNRVEAKEEVITPKISEFKLGYAPFREGKITDVSQADKAFQDKNFQAWKQMARTFAQNIGLEVISDPNTVGKYGATSELGEASSTPKVRGTDEQVELLAALMGTLAPQGQHTIMMNKYDVNGKDHEHVFTFASKEAAQDFYKNGGKYGVKDLSLDPDSNSVMFIGSGKDGFDLNNLIKDYGQQITGHEENNINTRFLSQGEYSGILDKHGDQIGEQYSQEHRQNVIDAIQLAKERARRFGSDYDQKSQEAKVEAEKATQNYIDNNKKQLGLPDSETTSVKKIDNGLAKAIKDAYDALPVDDSKNPEVKAAYEKAAKEIDSQFNYLTKDLGIKVEFIKDDPYKNSEEMFDDIINNKRLKVYQGGEPHPFLGDSTKDASGFTANEKLRAIHDYFGHFVNRNQFGKVGEEAAWVDHSKMFSPEAQRAISTETRGQNSWVNFSGVNDAAIEKMQKGNQLIKEGKVTEGNKLIQEGQSEFKFAEQKVALMPKEFTDWTIYSEKGKPAEIKETEEVKPTEVKEKIKITAPKIEEPVIEEPKPVKTPKEIAISKKALGDNYNFSKDFDVRGGDVVATDVLTTLNKKAKRNNVNLDVQIASEVDSMVKRGIEPTEFNIITAGSHLLNIDKKIEAAQTRGDLLEVENLNEQRKQVLDVLRTLGNKAGRNLGLFNLVFHDVDASEIKTTRSYIKKFLNVDEVPETVADLNKSNLTAEQKKQVKPYVEKIEKIKSEFESVEKKVDKNIVEINNEEVNAAIEKARAEGFEEGMKSASTEVKQKKSKKIKDLAAQIRRSDEFDKFLQGAGGLGDIKKAGVVDLGTYKEIVANVLEAVAKAVELGENVTDAIKKASQKFADVDQGKLISDVKTIMSKAALPSKKETMDKISEIAKSKGVSAITKEMSDEGLIKDIVNSYLGSDLTNDKILEAATNDLKSILPNVTRESVSDAYVGRGEFKKETKAKIEDEINKKKADIRRLAVKEARLRALEAADDYHLEETKEGKKRVTSEYEKELDDKISALLKEKNDLQKEQKVSKAPKTEQDKIDEINKEIQYVKETKSVYEQAIQNPKKASDALIAARKERDATYAGLGLKLEKNAKSPILVEREYQNAVAEIENSNLSKTEKNNKIEELTAQRDLDLEGTKQGVVSSLLDDINNLNSESKNADLNIKLRSILNGLEPTGEKLDDQINKAYVGLGKILEDKSLTKEEINSINEIITNLERNNQLTSDELSAQRLKKQWENEIRKAETDIASGNFTKIPNNTYDYRRNDQLVILNKARENKSGQYNRLVADAKEKKRTLAEKAFDASTKFLVSGVHTTAKVAEAGSFKPFMDSIVDVTTGGLASYITGAPYISPYSVKKGFKTFAAFKNKEAAQEYIKKLQNNRDIALANLQEANQNGSQSDIKKADKEFKKADLEYAVSTLYNSIEANSLSSFWEYLKHGATDYDVSIGKSSKKDISDYRTKLAKTGYVLDGWIRMHSAMKSTLSARPEMMRTFSATLKDFQNKGKELTPENISLAMVLAADAYEAGRLTNKTALSKIISRGKGSEKYLAQRLLTKGVMPVSTIAINLAKRGIDYSVPLGAEGLVRLAMETRKGMKLNEVEGKTYDSMISRIKDGWNRIPLKERVYINGVISRGLFGSAIMLVTAYGLGNGMIKYGGTYGDQKKRKIIGTDGEPLKPGEWEFFGERLPKAASLFLNHLPEFLAVSLIADNYQINQMGGTIGDKFATTIDEVEARLPFQTLVGILNPDKAVNTLLDRFTRFVIVAEAGGLLDEKAEFRDKSEFINRLRANIGLGFYNATKEQQKQIDEIRKSLRGLPEGVLTPEDEKEIDSIIMDIKNMDFGELETKKAMEEIEKESKKQ